MDEKQEYTIGYETLEDALWPLGKAMKYFKEDGYIDEYRKIRKIYDEILEMIPIIED